MISRINNRRLGNNEGVASGIHRDWPINAPSWEDMRATDRIQADLKYKKERVCLLNREVETILQLNGLVWPAVYRLEQGVEDWKVRERAIWIQTRLTDIGNTSLNKLNLAMLEYQEAKILAPILTDAYNLKLVAVVESVWVYEAKKLIREMAYYMKSIPTYFCGECEAWWDYYKEWKLMPWKNWSNTEPLLRDLMELSDSIYKEECAVTLYLNPI